MLQFLNERLEQKRKANFEELDGKVHKSDGKSAALDEKVEGLDKTLHRLDRKVDIILTIVELQDYFQCFKHIRREKKKKIGNWMVLLPCLDLFIGRALKNWSAISSTRCT